ncbi:hypothetical protein M4951_15165 [Blastopirellula sp. J2-11]|uniref:hypothetical protein n=1 Tax=Blastopirellula sp. J2-11 TaxID=2943192 RepID=UPI0021C7985D|nr:hypothetical protein [Blastopirellula sp. J2-11]UUO04725.1 hypothetical protein M4951_15165 [Blastopirellula sp. J2-11]
MAQANLPLETTGGPADRRRRWTRLLIAVGIVAVVWLVILPQIAETPPVKRHIEKMQAAGIDPSAMFYSELEPHLFLQPQK